MHICYFCKHEFQQISSYKFHITKKNKCSYLIKNLDIKSKDDYDKYVELHKSDPSNPIFGTEEDLKKELQCKYCSDFFTKKSSLQRHLNTCKRKKLIEMMNSISGNVSDNVSDNSDIVSNILSSNIA